MAVSIIEIDVRDQAFKEFQALFSKYQAQVDAMPGAWGKIDASVKKATNPFEKIAKIVEGTGDQIRKATTYQDKFKAAATGTGKVFGVMAQSTKSIAVNLKNATAQILKWASLSTLFSGLLGAGGLFGIARLAQNASNSRRQSQGLGVTPGEHEAAKVNFEKLVDVDSMLAKINEARNDVTKRWAFSAAGLNPADMEGKSNAEVMKLLIPLLKKTNEQAGGTLQGAQAHGLMEFTDMATLTRLKAVQQQEIDAATASYDKDREGLAIADKTQAAWQSFNQQLQRAGATIENMFISKLVSLTGPLSKLSEAFTRAVKVFLDSPQIGKWIEQLGHGLESFAKYLTSDEFQKNVSSFLDAVDSFAGALYSAGKTLGKVLGFGAEKSLKASEYRKLDEIRKIDPKLADKLQNKLENPTASKEFSWWSLKGADTRESDLRTMISNASKSDKDGALPRLLQELGINGQNAIGKIKAAPSMTPAEFSKAAASSSGNPYDDLERKKKLPDGVLSGIEWVETRNRDIQGPVTKTGERAQGPFQFMRDTAKQYGVKDVHNEQQAASGAGDMMKDLLDKYKGDLSKALAAYNWGSGNLDRKGVSAEPRETREYVKQVMGRMPQAQATMIRIENATGGSAVVIANQIAQ